jgi:hypothetical protein
MKWLNKELKKAGFTSVEIFFWLPAISTAHCAFTKE